MLTPFRDVTLGMFLNDFDANHLNHCYTMMTMSTPSYVDGKMSFFKTNLRTRFHAQCALRCP